MSALTSAQPVSVSYLPASAREPAAGPAGVASWIVYVQAPGGARFTLSVNPVDSTCLEMDEEMAVVVAADLFRPGWAHEARPLTRPIVVDESLFRGFSLVRSTRLCGEGERERWSMAALAEGSLLTDFNWASEIAALDAFHAFVFERDPSHG
jgi:hypothetical protein